MEDLNKNILRMIGLYRVATRQTVATHLPEDQEPDKRLNRLLVERYVQVHRGFSGNRTLYQLTKRGAATIGLSEARARRMGGQALLKHLGILFFCHAENTGRYRVEDRELASAVEGKVPEGAHCLSRLRDEIAIVNCYVPGPHTPAVTVSRHVRSLVAEARGTSMEVIRRRRRSFAGVTRLSGTEDPAVALNGGKLVIIGPVEKPKWLRFKCPCGCGDVIALNPMGSHYPRWKVEEHDGGTISVTPSVDAKTCGAHFWIRQNQIDWV